MKAEMVEDPGDYGWSSYKINALGMNSDLCTPHEEFLSLEIGSDDRQRNYRSLFAQHVDEDLLVDIRSSTN